jgi:hypothetical protein
LDPIKTIKTKIKVVYRIFFMNFNINMDLQANYILYSINYKKILGKEKTL